MNREQAINLVWRTTSPTFRKENSDGTHSVLVTSEFVDGVPMMEDVILEQVSDERIRKMLPEQYRGEFKE